jgi:choline dehydrogenase
VSRCTDPHASHHAFLRASEEHGFRADPLHDFNRPEPDGVAGFFPKNIVNGRRHSAAAAFLEPVLARPNVEIRSSARVTRLILESTRVVGVEFVTGGLLQRVRAAREVVLAAGAVDSPRLLMLSGVGPADDLRRHRIPVVAHVPGVGANLQDHLKLSIRWRGKSTLPGSTVTAGLFTSGTSASPADLQFYVGRGLEQPDALMTITVSLVRTRSRGSIALALADPMAAPLILARYLQEQIDVDTLAEGVRLVRMFGNARAYDGLRSEEIEPGSSATTKPEIERFIREKADSIYHVAGTCRMGPASAADSVVDAELRVHGVEGLRVADASIMPELPNAPPHAACVAIGEKCADLLRNP